MPTRVLKMLVLINLLISLSYRIPLPVKEVRILGSSGEYAVCPKCEATVDREYMLYCDRCGQRLDWTSFDNAVIVPTLAQKLKKTTNAKRETASVK